MASMRDIKRRKDSIQSTKQITKAMKLVSTVKLQRARADAERSQKYFRAMYDTVNNILSRVGQVDHKFLTPGREGKKAVVLISSNRGLAGGYNSNIAKLVTKDEAFTPDNTVIYAIGNKGREIMARNGYEIKEELPEVIEDPIYTDAMLLTERMLASFEAGEISEIYVAYTSFKNTVSHIPTLLKLLPVEKKEEEEVELDDKQAQMNFEPEDTEALDMIIPKYIASLIYGGLVDAVASENGARMQAMDNATSNAEEMIDDLTLKYNRARQGSITQELTEIIAGAEALG